MVDLHAIIDKLAESPNEIIVFTFLGFLLVFLFRKKIQKSDFAITLFAITLFTSSLLSIFSFDEIDNNRYIELSKIECDSENYSTKRVIKRFFNENDVVITVMEDARIRIEQNYCRDQKKRLVANGIMQKVTLPNEVIFAKQKLLNMDTKD